MTTNRNHWSEKEEQILFDIIKKNRDYVLEHSFNLASRKLNRSYSSIKQHYYYHKKQENLMSLKKKFRTIVNNGNYKITKKGNLFIVEV